MIVGTAGHIDHGKTTLVRALTGVDTDRLPEEKQRGISIELGYAFLDVPAMGDEAATRIGFIDVPGHERLVHTMLAGATGIDVALLLVAADDGAMPQTREHLAVLSLLGLSRGAVVITKADRADAARLAAVASEVEALVEGSALDGAPVFTVAATTGDGLPALRDWLFATARDGASRPQADVAGFRLAIDRAFTLGGVGTVVTGTVHAGRVRVGDTLLIGPAAHPQPVRVRSIHAQNQAVDEAEAGQRCALNLAGVPKDAVQRGEWLMAPAVALSTQRLDVALRVWPGEAKALRSGTSVHVHLGAQAVMGTVAVLDDGHGTLKDALAPGEEGRAQLLLHAPAAAWRGQRVVLRDAAASRTLAGGPVVDPQGPTRSRRTPQRLAELTALQAADAPARLRALLAASPQGVDLRRFAAAEGLAAAEGRLPPLLDATLAALPGGLVQREGEGASATAWALGPDPRAALLATLRATLAAFHATQPEELGPDRARLRRMAAPRLPEPLWRALLAEAQAAGTVVLSGACVHLPEHAVQLSATEQRIAQKIGPALENAGFEGAWARDLAKDSGESEALVRATLARLARRGELHQVVKDLYYPQTTMARLAQIARGVAQPRAQAGAAPSVTAAAFRDATGLGRKRAIQILEHLDRIGLLRRVGDEHRVRLDSPLFQETVVSP